MRSSQSTRLTRETLLKLDALKKRLPFLTTYESAILYLLSVENGTATSQPCAVPSQQLSSHEAAVTQKPGKPLASVLMDELLL